MSRSEQRAVTPIADVHIVREPKSGRGRYDVDTYVPARDADAVRQFVCWKTPRGWQVFCFAFDVGIPKNPAPRLGDFYAPQRRPDVWGSARFSAWSSCETHVESHTIWKTRGPYAASPRDIRRIYRAIFAD